MKELKDFKIPQMEALKREYRDPLEFVTAMAGIAVKATNELNAAVRELQEGFKSHIENTMQYTDIDSALSDAKEPLFTIVKLREKYAEYKKGEWLLRTPGKGESQVEFFLDYLERQGK